MLVCNITTNVFVVRNMINMAKQTNHFAITYAEIHLVRSVVGLGKILYTKHESGCLRLLKTFARYVMYLQVDFLCMHLNLH